MRKIFISYRRAEAEYAAGALGRELRRRFGDDQVFRDKEDIRGGAAWKQQLLHEIDRDCALLVLMGKDWADTRDNQGGRRLDNPDDGLRLEISDGIKDGAAIIPVLLENAQMPDVNELPPDLRRLADFNAVKLRDSDWERDVDTICRTLVRAGFREVEPAAPAAAPAPRVEPAVVHPPVSTGIGIKSIIGGILLLFAFAALASDDLDRDGHVGVAVVSVAAGILGLLAWRDPSTRARTAGAIVAVLGLLGFLGGLGGMDSAGPPAQAAPPQQLAALPAATTPGQPRDSLGSNVPPRVGTAELTTPGTAGLTTLELLRGHALVRFDPRAWRADAVNSAAPANYQYVHTNGEVYFKIISERIQIGLEKLADIGVMNAQKVDPNVTVTRRGSRLVNGLEMAVREFEATIEGIPFTFYVHYYSDAAGSIQLVGWTGRSLVTEHRPLIEQFVSGFEVTGRTAAMAK